VVDARRGGASAGRARGRGKMAAGTGRGDAGPAHDPGDGGAAQAPAEVGVLRMTAGARSAARTYLRIGGDVFPIYGDALRGWSPRPDDFRGLTACSPHVYVSLAELFFVLVNLCVGPWGEA